MTGNKNRPNSRIFAFFWPESNYIWYTIRKKATRLKRLLPASRQFWVHSEQETAPETEEAVPQEEAAAKQPFGMGAGTAEYVGAEYQWGPPTGGENYDEAAMPAVFVGDAEEEETARTKEPRPGYTYQIDAPGYDHTDEFEPEDISENKVIAMAAYLLGPLGVIIALLAGKESPYADFHMRQSLKFVVVEALLVIVSTLLCWTLIIPALAAIAWIVIGVVKIITFIMVCKGRSVEPAIIRSLGFLK